jgi:hypothetical protein
MLGRDALGTWACLAPAVHAWRMATVRPVMIRWWPNLESVFTERLMEVWCTHLAWRLWWQHSSLTWQRKGRTLRCVVALSDSG